MSGNDSTNTMVFNCEEIAETVKVDIVATNEMTEDEILDAAISETIKRTKMLIDSSPEVNDASCEKKTKKRTIQVKRPKRTFSAIFNFGRF
jgi:hypothetical protein